MSAHEDPRITAAREVLAAAALATYCTDPDAPEWTPEAVLDRHGRLRYVLSQLLAYVDEGAS